MIDLSQFEVTVPKATDNSLINRDGGITFVYHENGKRIVFSKRVLDALNNPDEVRFVMISGT